MFLVNLHICMPGFVSNLVQKSFGNLKYEINHGLNKLLSHQVPISREALMCHVVTT